MSARPKTIAELAALVSDGVAIDWEEVESTLSSERERRVAARLRALSAIAELQRRADAGVNSYARLVNEHEGEWEDRSHALEDLSQLNPRQAQIVELRQMGSFPDGHPARSDSEAHSLSGETLGRYRILEILGKGGMGEVYRAEDTALKRPVAVKILPEQFTRDPVRLARFERDGQLLASLNHPNIASIYGLEEADGIRFLVLELVEGETLAEHIAEGPLPLEEAVEIARQMAEGLEAAHTKGILHRDLKPKNIRITPEGQVKLLDFGIAKALRGEAAENFAPASTSLDTQPGLIAGTPTHMSPEQALGKKLDARSDLFSLSVVIYQMVTGALPFDGETRPAIFNEILNKAPAAPDRVNPALPAEISHILLKGLEKDRELRYQTASDLKADLERLKQDTTAGQSAIRRWVWPAAASGVVGMGAIGLWVAFWTSVPPLVRITQLTTLAGREFHPALSPEGDRVAFVWDGEKKDNFDVYVQEIAGGDTLRLTSDTAEDLSPTWSPDGSRIAFVRFVDGERRLVMVPSMGGSEKVIHSQAGPAPAWRFRSSLLAWHPNGRQLAVSDLSPEGRAEIHLVTIESGEKRRLTAGQHGIDVDPAFSPDGGALAFSGWRTASGRLGSADVYVAPVTGGEARRLTFDDRYIVGLTWTASAREIVFSSSRDGLFALWRVSVAGGNPVRVAEGGTNAFLPNAALRGSGLVFTQDFLSPDIWRLHLEDVQHDPDSAAPLIVSTRGEHDGRLSPDGAKIVFRSDRSGSDEIWLADADGTNPTALTSFGGPLTGAATWSPDGARIAFDSRAAGHADIYVCNRDGDMLRRVTEESSDDVRPAWSLDGQSIYFGSNRSGDWQIWRIPSAGGLALQVTKHGGRQAMASPDGRSIFVAKLPPTEGLWQVSLETGEERKVIEHVVQGPWTVGAQGIFFVSSRTSMLELLSFETGLIRTLTTLEPVLSMGSPAISVSPDGRNLLYDQDHRESDIMLLERFR